MDINYIKEFYNSCKATFSVEFIILWNNVGKYLFHKTLVKKVSLYLLYLRI